MKRQSKVKGHGTARVQDQCIHYWIIEPPDELVSKGVCIKCGAKKNFVNQATIHYQEDLVFPSQRHLRNGKNRQRRMQRNDNS